MIFQKTTVIRSSEDLEKYCVRERSRAFESNSNVHQRVIGIIEKLLPLENRKRELELLVKQLDSPEASEINILRRPTQINLPSDHANAIDCAIQRVTEFHQVQLEKITCGWDFDGDRFAWHKPVTKKGSGTQGQILTPVESAGIYVPGGLASYPSSVIMNVIPAKVAGVKRIIIATPPGADGCISTAVQYAAWKLGVEALVAAGGAHAIATLALGLGDQFDGADVIAGPGNDYVNEAKRYFWGKVGLDGLAGPSEIAVALDDHGSIEFSVADLLAQVEHAPDNIARLYVPSEKLLDLCILEVEAQLENAPRKTVMGESLIKHGEAVVLAYGLFRDHLLDAIEAFAPEHLSLQVEHGSELMKKIRNAGSISIGSLSAQSFGDYSAGPSHTLPTKRASRFGNAVNVQTFMKLTSFLDCDENDALELAEIAEVLGNLEGLPAHATNARMRNFIKK